MYKGYLNSNNLGYHNYIMGKVTKKNPGWILTSVATWIPQLTHPVKNWILPWILYQTKKQTKKHGILHHVFFSDFT